MKSRFLLMVLVVLFSLSTPNEIFAQSNVVDEDDEEQDIYSENFRHANGISGSVGLTTTGFIVSSSYIRLISPDWIAFTTLSITTGKDPNEVEQFNNQGFSVVFDKETGLQKLNSLFLIPVTLGAQRRLFRENINSSFRPFIEAGAGPTFGYLYDYKEGFFNGGSMKIGLNGFVGAGAYFGSNPLSLQGLTIRYQIDAFGSDLELLPNRFLRSFSGISLNLIFGTFF